MTPMHIGLQTWGTLGDVMPMLQLGSALRSRGHKVTLAITSIDGQDYRARGSALGLDIIQAPDTLHNHMETFPEKLQRRNKEPMLKVVLEELFFPLVPEIYEASLQLCQSCDAVIGHFLVYPLKLAAQWIGTPHISVTLWPGIVPGGDEIPVSLPLNLQRYLPFKWQVLQWSLDRSIGKQMSNLWHQVGFPPPRPVVPNAWFSERLNLVLSSPQLWGTQRHWHHQHRLTGSIAPVSKVSEAHQQSIPPALSAFLHAGPAPVWMTFGSMQRVKPERALVLMIAAARHAGCRAIIQTKLAATLNPSEYPDLHFVDYIDHQHILPHCAAMLHHGGAGTSHAAARNGVPSVVIAFIPEQMSWGRQLARAGVALAPIYFSAQTSAVQIGDALSATLNHPELRQQARALREQMQQEDGLASCVELIEQHLKPRQKFIKGRADDTATPPLRTASAA